MQTEYRRDTNGASVINAFPREQTTFTSPERSYNVPGEGENFDSGTPVNPPAVVVPRLAPPTTTLHPAG